MKLHRPLECARLPALAPHAQISRRISLAALSDLLRKGETGRLCALDTTASEIKAPSTRSQ